MAPEVERFPEKSLSQSYFCVNLASQEEFDADLFDEQAKVLVGGFADFADLKFIVVDDKMFVFPEHIPHQEFYKNIKTEFPGTLQCAGLIKIDFPRDSSPERHIFGSSLSLYYAKGLSRGESQRYKLEGIKPKLDQFFEVF